MNEIFPCYLQYKEDLFHTLETVIVQQHLCIHQNVFETPKEQGGYLVSLQPVKKLQYLSFVFCGGKHFRLCLNKILVPIRIKGRTISNEFGQVVLEKMNVKWGLYIFIILRSSPIQRGRGPSLYKLRMLLAKFECDEVV